MHNIWGKTVSSRKHQEGYTLLVMLVFVTFFGAALAALLFDKNNSELRNQAYASGAHVSEIARAARIFVRDRSFDPGDFTAATPGDPFHRDRIARAAFAIPLSDGTFSAGPVRTITVDDLIGAGLLPDGFGQQNGAGDYITPLGHEIRIIAANSPVTGDPRVNTNTVATAYVYLLPSPRGGIEFMNDVIVGLRENGVAVSAPRFDNAGNNITVQTCGTQLAFALWDTGCLTLADFQELTGDINFAPGSLIIPSWRAVQFDLRAVMRYPQPENPGYATMLTDLHMGQEIDTDGNGVCDDVDQIVITDDDPTTDAFSGICRVEDDDSLRPTIADQDRRFDIRDARQARAEGLIITPMGANGDVRSRIDPTTGVVVADTTPEIASSPTLDPGMREGLIVSGSIIGEGDTRIYDEIPLPTSRNGIRFTSSDMIVRRNVVLSNPNTPDAANPDDPDQPDILIQRLRTDTLRSDVFRNDGPTAIFDPVTMRLSEMEVDGNFVLNESGTATLEEVQYPTGAGAQLRAEHMTLTGNTRVDNVSVIGTAGNALAGGGGYNAVIAEFGATNAGGETRIQGGLSIGDSAVFGQANNVNSSANIINITNGSNARCFGDCPDRCSNPGSPFDPPPATCP